jgi:hypothetical protein
VANATLNGIYSVYEANPQKNSQNDINKVSITLTSGTYNGYIYSADSKITNSGSVNNTTKYATVAEDTTNLFTKTEVGHTTYEKLTGDKTIILTKGTDESEYSISYTFKITAPTGSSSVAQYVLDNGNNTAYTGETFTFTITEADIKNNINNGSVINHYYFNWDNDSGHIYEQEVVLSLDLTALTIKKSVTVGTTTTTPTVSEKGYLIANVSSKEELVDAVKYKGKYTITGDDDIDLEGAAIVARDGVQLIFNSDGNTITNGSVKIGNTYYVSSADALKAALAIEKVEGKDSITIILTDNIELNDEVEAADSGATINFNGYKVSGGSIKVVVSTTADTVTTETTTYYVSTADYLSEAINAIEANSSLSEASEAATSTVKVSIIKLTDNIVATEATAITLTNKDATIDLNGYNLDLKSYIAVSTDANLTIKDTSASATKGIIKQTADNAKIYALNGGQLTIENVSITNTNNNNSIVAQSAASVTLDNVTITNTAAETASNPIIRVLSGAEVTIKNSNITGSRDTGVAAIDVNGNKVGTNSGATLTIEDTNITFTGSFIVTAQNGANVTVNDTSESSASSYKTELVSTGNGVLLTNGSSLDFNGGHIKAAAYTVYTYGTNNSRDAINITIGGGLVESTGTKTAAILLYSTDYTILNLKGGTIKGNIPVLENLETGTAGKVYICVAANFDGITLNDGTGKIITKNSRIYVYTTSPETDEETNTYKNQNWHYEDDTEKTGAVVIYEVTVDDVQGIGGSGNSGTGSTDASDTDIPEGLGDSENDADAE